MSNPFRRRRDPFVIKSGKIEDVNISGVIKNRWVEDAWLTDSTNSSPSSLKEFLGLAIPRRRFLILLIFILFLGLLIWGRLFYLQLAKGDYYRALAEGNRLRTKPIPAERGLIFDRNLNPLVINIPNFTLNLLPQDLPKEENERQNILNKIAEITQVPAEEISKKIEEFKSFSYRSLTLKDNLDYQTAIRLMVAAADLPGLEIERSFQRQYFFTPLENFPLIASLSHLLGYVGRVTKDDLILNPFYLPTDPIGKSGLEKFYEKELRGLYGKKEIEVDALGKEKNTVARESPQAGKNLILSIDLEMQKKLEKELQAELAAKGKKRAAAVALDPRNGEILALVNLPSFNNNLFSQGLSAEDYQKLLTDENAPLFSRAWAGTYPSGSVIKPIIAAGALNENLINRQTTFLSTGGLPVGQWFFPDWKEGGHGPTNVIKALAESVNTFFYIIGGGYGDFIGLGLEKITFYLKKFGLANTLGIDLPGEAAGFIPSKEWKEEVKKERWYVGDTYNLSIGQGDLLVTPLQVANYTAMIANGGTFYQPRLLKAVVDPSRQTEFNLEPKILEKNVLPDFILKIIREGMRAAVTQGSSQLLNTLPWPAAGKTGTAQWSKKYPAHAWFTSFIPYNEPRLVLTILIEEGGEGSQTAAPVAHRFLHWWASQELHKK